MMLSLLHFPGFPRSTENVLNYETVFEDLEKVLN